MRKTFLHIAFSAYMFSVFFITILNRPATERRYVLRPFWELMNCISGNTLYWAAQIGMNILMLMPLGFFLPFLSEKYNSFRSVIAVGFLLSVFIEILQFYTGRGLCETDDIINNTVGTFLGYMLFRLFGKKFRGLVL